MASVTLSLYFHLVYILILFVSESVIVEFYEKHFPFNTFNDC